MGQASSRPVIFSFTTGYRITIPCGGATFEKFRREVEPKCLGTNFSSGDSSARSAPRFAERFIVLNQTSNAKRRAPPPRNIATAAKIARIIHTNIFFGVCIGISNISRRRSLRIFPSESRLFRSLLFPN